MTITIRDLGEALRAYPHRVYTDYILVFTDEDIFKVDTEGISHYAHITEVEPKGSTLATIRFIPEMRTKRFIRSAEDAIRYIKEYRYEIRPA